MMGITVKLDELLYQRRMTLTQLAERVDITLANLSILKTGKARAIGLFGLTLRPAMLVARPTGAFARQSTVRDSCWRCPP